MPKYLVHQTYPEHLEGILKEGLRPSSNTGLGVYKYNNVKFLTKPASKKSDNLIQFDKNFLSFIFDPDYTYNNVNVINQQLIILFDMKLIDNICNKKNKECYLSNLWIAGKKLEGHTIDYDKTKSYEENMRTWSKFILKSRTFHINELLVSGKISPKYIKAVLLLPPKYKTFYATKNRVKQVILDKTVDATDLYFYQAAVMNNLKDKFPNIKFAFDWDQLD